MKILILSELWHPQGGGAELATQLYAKKMLEADMEITVLTNSDALIRMKSDKLSVKKISLGIGRINKVGLTIAQSSIEKAVTKLAKTHDLVYVPGKFLFMIPNLKKANPDLRVITHLHDYQIVCPHASMYNLLNNCKCSYIWSNSQCVRCTYRYESIDKGDLSQLLLGVIGGCLWRNSLKLSKLDETLECIDSIITVSKGQNRIITENLGRHSSSFQKKSSTIYNPVDDVDYAPPLFSNALCLGFFGGERYLKGYDIVLKLMERIDREPMELSVTKTSSTVSTDKIKLLGYISPQKMAKLYRKIWMVLFASRWDEPLPYTVIESQLRGRPVIATNVGGVNETLVKPGFTGTLTDNNFVNFKDCSERYVELLSRRPSETSREISTLSREFFQIRSTKAYEQFFKIIT